MAVREGRGKLGDCAGGQGLLGVGFAKCQVRTVQMPVDPRRQPSDTGGHDDAALIGLKVAQLGQLLASPFAAKTRADFGAEVMEIAPPGAGDSPHKRRILKDCISVWTQVKLCNTRSLALDLPAPEGQDMVRRRASRPDSHADLSRVRVSTRVVCGRQDPVTPPANHQAMTAELKQWLGARA